MLARIHKLFMLARIWVSLYVPAYLDKFDHIFFNGNIYCVPLNKIKLNYGCIYGERRFIMSAYMEKLGHLCGHGKAIML